MKLRIVTAKKTSTYSVSWVDIHTPNGNSVILESHAPMIAKLVANKNITFLLKTGEIEHITIEKNGIIEIQRHAITVLL